MWIKIKPYKDSDVLIYINQQKTIAVLGKSVFVKDEQSWNLTHHVLQTIIKEFLQYILKKILDYLNIHLLSIWVLSDSGIKVELDNTQYRGAKGLWKRISKVIDVEVYDERLIKDSEIRSEDSEHFLKPLRMV